MIKDSVKKWLIKAKHVENISNMGRKASIRYDPITDVLSIDFGKYGVSSLTKEPLNGIFLIYGYEKPFHQVRRRLVALEHIVT